jgi:hypothetical protein
LAGVLRLTIAFLPIERLWATRFEAGLDRGVVGEAELEAVPGELPPLGRPSPWRLGDLEIAGEQVVDRAGVGGTIESEALAQRLEGIGVLGGSQVEVATEEQRGVSCPLGRSLGGSENVSYGQVELIVGRVQVGDAEASAIPERDAGERHRPPLRPTSVNR